MSGDQQKLDPMPEDDNRTSAEQAALQIRELIIAGDLLPGAPLRQDDLARQLGISRTPLRTALAALSRDSLVDYAPNRGYRVRQFVPEDIAASFAVRANLEALACRLAGQQQSASDLHTRLAAAVRLGDEILACGFLDPERLEEYRGMNVAFHSAIISAAGNRWLSEFINRTHEVPLASDRIILWEDYGIICRSHDDHHRIASALRQGDGERAANIMQEHVTFAGELLLRQLATDATVLTLNKSTPTGPTGN